MTPTKEDTMTIPNIAIATLGEASGLYDAPGVDLLRGEDDAHGEAEFVQWVPFHGTFTQWNDTQHDPADDMLHTLGYSRTSQWEYLPEYRTCQIEPA